MTHRSWTARTLVVFAMAAILAGCGGDNPTKPKAPVSPYSDRSTPQRVLQDLAIAYSNRDSIRMKSLYDSTYIGQSNDLTQPPASQLLTFTYTDEVEHVAAMARAHSITSVSLLFASPARLPSDDLAHPEWALLQMPGNNILLEIVDGANTYKLTSAAGLTEAFSFAATPDSTSPTDTTWKIIRWNEILQAGP